MAKIILVEDDPMIAEIYMRKFSSAGFEIVNAKTGKEALRYAAEPGYDLMLLDMVIPELSGMEVLKEIKKSGKYPSDLSVVVFSNLSQTESQQEALEIGADGFIGKTEYSPTELVEEVRRLLNSFAEMRKNKARALTGVIPNGKKILLIEDEDIFLEMFGKKIQDEGYDVTFARNGAWGLKEAQEEDYDLIITDMVMPAMGGLEIVRKLRDEEKTRDIPILVISASVGDEESDQVMKMGISGFFVKTQIVPSDLTRSIAEILK